MKQSGEIMASAIDGQTPLEAIPGRTEHPLHKRRLMKFVKVYVRTSYHHAGIVSSNTQALTP